MAKRIAGVALVAALLAVAPADASTYREPRLTVDRDAMISALTCYGRLGGTHPAPLIFAPGTGSTGSQVYILGKGAFDLIGRPVCTVTFPDRTTADVQVSVQYLVFAIRSLARRVGRPVAVAGVSQGGLLARMALTYWPGVRPLVSDVVTAAATFHGATASAEGAARCLTEGCAPAIWQQGSRSHLMRALNDGRDETPGPTAWTTIRSTADEVVRPTSSSRLRGATNILIQGVCPGRTTSHLGTAVDSVTFAALADALSHKGPAKVSRLPPDVCAHPYGAGLDEAQTSAFLALAAQGAGPGLTGLPTVRREPRLRAWVERRTP